MTNSSSGKRGATPLAQLLGAMVAVLGIATVPLDLASSRYTVLGTTLIALCVLHPPPRRLIRRSLLALPMLAGLLLPLALTGAQERAVHLAVRAICSLLTVLSFTCRLDTLELPQAFAHLGLPSPLITILTNVVRQAAAIREQGQRIVLARKLRGANGNVVSAEILASLLTSTARRADRIELAMKLRGASNCPPPSISFTSQNWLRLAFGGLIGGCPHLASWVLLK